MPTALESFLADLKQVAQGLADQAMIDRGSRWIEELERENPLMHTFVMGLARKDSKAIMDSLSIWFPQLKPYKGNTNAIGYLDKVKQGLKEMKR